MLHLIKLILYNINNKSYLDVNLTSYILYSVFMLKEQFTLKMKVLSSFT